MPRSVVLQKLETQVPIADTGNLFELEIRITEPQDMPAELFVHQFSLPDGRVDPYPQFLHVATAADLVSIPANLAATGRGTGRFRESSCLLRFTSAEDLQDTWNLINKDIENLIDHLNRVETLFPQEDFIVGELS